MPAVGSCARAWVACSSGISSRTVRVGMNVKPTRSPWPASSPAAQGSVRSNASHAGIPRRWRGARSTLLHRELQRLHRGTAERVGNLDHELVAAAGELGAAAFEAVGLDLNTRGAVNALGDIQLQEPIEDLERRRIYFRTRCGLEAQIDIHRRLDRRAGAGFYHGNLR